MAPKFDPNKANKGELIERCLRQAEQIRKLQKDVRDYKASYERERAVRQKQRDKISALRYALEDIMEE